MEKDGKGGGEMSRYRWKDGTGLPPTQPLHLPRLALFLPLLPLPTSPSPGVYDMDEADEGPLPVERVKPRAASTSVLREGRGGDERRGSGKPRREGKVEEERERDRQGERMTAR